MSKHMTIINLACTITKLRKWGEAWKHSAESAQAATARMHQANKDLERAKVITDGLVDKLIADRDAAWTERDTQAADHSRQLTEHRAAFGARTEADAKIIAGLRSEIGAARMAVLERDSLISERDGLLTQVQDMRAEMERLKLACSTYAADWDTAGKACRMRVDEYPLSAVIRLVRDDAERAEVAKRLVAERDALRAEVAALQERLRASIARGDFAQMEVAALKSQNPKQHPVKVGEWIVRTAAGAQLTPIGTVALVVSVADGLPDGYEYVIAGGRWHSDYCEPCDPPATHDTEAGKAAAESGLLLNGGLDVRKVTT